jgi:RecB family endonuclease NucS
MLSNNSEMNTLLTNKYDGLTALRNSYVLEFLDMPRDYKEKDLRKAIVGNLKDFILEFGKEFSFIGEEYRIQVGNSDFYIDLLFYNRELKCLVAIELKAGSFKPDHIGQMQLYLEALDRNVRKKGENPSVGLILCTDKDDTVVEYMLSKGLTPSLIAAYELALPDKMLLQQRVKELARLASRNSE